MSEPLNPVQIEAAIREASQRIAKGVSVVSERYRAFLQAEHTLDVAFARAYMAFGGPAHEKRYAAELETIAQREARDDADAAHRYAEKQWRALSSELDALRSIGASVRQAYAAGGGAS
ncbi:hypothetical protein [Microbacterium sp. BR1]|uniref:hypothetical protein n=1 Tax=Microbacterium sp. BR1 TaxID=1070896 RepID=UPI000C2B8337|nr:hypothetical protein [Microbacterium sp. BR1]